MNPHTYPGNSGAISNHEPESNQRRLKNQTLVLALGALGVVYGDIGTSPLYAIRECFHGHHAIALTPGNIFGVMSLVFWPLRWGGKDGSTLRRGGGLDDQRNHC